MMSKGFITVASFGKANADLDETDLHIEDAVGGNNDDDAVVTVWISANSSTLSFTRPDVEAFIEALQEVLNRYPRKAE